MRLVNVVSKEAAEGGDQSNVPEPVGSIVALAFRVTGYEKDEEDGSMMATMENIGFDDGKSTGLVLDCMGLFPNSCVVLNDASELAKICAKAKTAKPPKEKPKSQAAIQREQNKAFNEGVHARFLLVRDMFSTVYVAKETGIPITSLNGFIARKSMGNERVKLLDNWLKALKDKMSGTLTKLSDDAPGAEPAAPAPASNE